MRVLIVDSSVQIMDRLEEILSESSTITTVYKSGSYREAANIFKLNNPDILLLDIFLPENESLLFLKEIKKTGHKTFIIALSANTQHEMQGQYTSLGVDHVFDKYHDFEKIPGLINSISNKINL